MGLELEHRIFSTHPYESSEEAPKWCGILGKLFFLSCVQIPSLRNMVSSAILVQTHHIHNSPYIQYINICILLIIPTHPKSETQPMFSRPAGTLIVCALNKPVFGFSQPGLIYFFLFFSQSNPIEQFDLVDLLYNSNKCCVTRLNIPPVEINFRCTICVNVLYYYILYV